MENYDKKLLNAYWQEYFELFKHMLYFEFGLNLLGGIQRAKPELLFKNHIAMPQPLEYYLAHFTQDMVIDSNFLYEMAIASLLTLKEEIAKTMNNKELHVTP